VSGEDPGEERAINHARWEELAALHGQDGYYDSAGLIAGADSLTAEEDTAIGDVTGLDVLHVQCHIGFDAISLARRGARVTGVDFSAAALAKAADLAERCRVDVEWVEGDATALPPSLSGRFALAYATVGVICWIGDMRAWMRSVLATLRPGGRLVLLDAHPLAMMIETIDPPRVDMPYADDGPRRYEAVGSSYAEGVTSLHHTTTIEYAHSLGELVTAAADAGFRIDALREHLDSTFDHPPGRASREADGRWRLRIDGEPLPLLFTLIATRPA
jgi:SAM-dependent methyltransferase